jgi:hypothetical protein
MKAIKWMAALAAVGSIGIVTSQAAALVCYSPAPGFFSDIVEVGSTQNLEVSCLSNPTGGSQTLLTGRGSRGNSNQVRANLTQGSGYARAGAYGTSRAGLGCFAIDTNPTAVSAVTATCSGTVGFVDVEIGN